VGTGFVESEDLASVTEERDALAANIDGDARALRDVAERRHPILGHLAAARSCSNASSVR
jgi:hypothetical protein